MSIGASHFFAEETKDWAAKPRRGIENDMSGKVKVVLGRRLESNKEEELELECW